MQVSTRTRRAPGGPHLFRAACLALALSASAAPAGAVETYRHRLAEAPAPTTSLERWSTVLRLLTIERAGFNDCTTHGGCPGAGARLWLENLARFARLAQRAQIIAVNRLINRWPYASDDERYGRPDHWATPAQFLAGAGDCEDFAIAKYESLRRLGVPVASMRIVVVNDISEDRAHAILLVLHEGAWLVLDNQVPDPRPLERVTRYEPLASMNEHAVWRYSPLVEIPLPARGLEAR